MNALMPEKKRPVGLLDVDNTIFDIKTGKVNRALLDAYKELGIRDIYCFTNMDFATLASEHQHLDRQASTGSKAMEFTRAEIVSLLEKEGFRVHGVVTPIDIGYDKTVGSAYQELYVPEAKRFISGEITFSSSSDDPEFSKKAKTIFTIKEKNREKQPDFCRDLSIKLDSSGDINKAFNIKGMLFDFFNKKKPSWAGKAIFADDELSCLSSAEQVAIARGISGGLTTIHVDGKKSFEESSYISLKNTYKDKIMASLTDEEKTTLAQSRGEWLKDQQAENDFQQFVAKLKGSIPQKWQATVSTTSLQAKQPKTDGQLDPKSKALQELACAIERLGIEVRNGKISYEEAKGILKPTIQNVIEKSKEKGLMSSIGIQFSQTAANLKSFVDSHYSQNPTTDFRGRLHAMERVIPTEKVTVTPSAPQIKPS